MDRHRSVCSVGIFRIQQALAIILISPNQTFNLVDTHAGSEKVDLICGFPTNVLVACITCFELHWTVPEANGGIFVPARYFFCMPKLHKTNLKTGKPAPVQTQITESYYSHISNTVAQDTLQGKHRVQTFSVRPKISEAVSWSSCASKQPLSSLSRILKTVAAVSACEKRQ